MDPIHEVASPRAHGDLILLFSAAGLLVLSVGVIFATIMPSGIRLGSQAAVILGSFAAGLALHKNTRLRPYWRLAFAYFVASCALLFHAGVDMLIIADAFAAFGVER